MTTKEAKNLIQIFEDKYWKPTKKTMEVIKNDPALWLDEMKNEVDIKEGYIYYFGYKLADLHIIANLKNIRRKRRKKK